jgi:hypothetical protein
MELLQRAVKGEIDVKDEYFKSGKCWKSFKVFMGRPWWSRIWILQEVAMAVNDPLYCGFSSVSESPSRPAKPLHKFPLKSLLQSSRISPEL